MSFVDVAREGGIDFGEEVSAEQAWGYGGVEMYCWIRGWEDESGGGERALSSGDAASRARA